MSLFIHKFLIEPVSRTLYFGSIKNLELGGEGYSEILPPPSMIAGMVRSAIISYSSNFINNKDLMGSPDDYYYDFKWRLIGPYLVQLEEERIRVFYPIPISLKLYEIKDKYVLIKPSLDDMEKISEIDEVYGIEKIQYIPHFLLNSNTRGETKAKYISPTNAYWLISGDVLEKILGDERKIEVRKESLISFDEAAQQFEKILGIGLDREKKSVKIEGGRGMTYVIHRIRLKDNWRYIFGIATDDKEISEILKNALDGKTLILGGKHSLVNIKYVGREVEFIEEKQLNEYMSLPETFSIHFTTPAVLSVNNGEVYDVSKLGDVLGEYNKCLEVLSMDVLISLVGGWNAKKRVMRELHYALSPGSSFILKNKGCNLTYFDFLFNRIFINSKYRGAYGACLIGKI